jgi:pilus assembly protein Flp/PilA
MGLRWKSDSLFGSILEDERGATAIEYALIAVLISVAIIAGATVIGSRLNSTFSGVASNLK